MGITRLHPIVQEVIKFIEFLKRAFDAEQTELLTRPDRTIMHAEVRIGDSVIMIGGSTEEFKPIAGSLYLYVQDTDATYERALQAGAVSINEPADQFYGDRSAGVKDEFGNYWWIATHIEDVPPEGMQRRAGDSSGI